ncbi:Ankyrin repeat-containing protein [Apiospora rasikravindrae]|uniref:Ankyrin repeat-containing protein n=1 Tax=Apiospora rasikravindrae TaxID=990691 RepID=A0ABR1U0A7_9PEZI
MRSLELSEHTATRQCLSDVYSDCKSTSPETFSSKDLINREQSIRCQDFEYSSDGDLLQQSDRHQAVTGFANELQASASDITRDHFAALDEHLATLFQVRLDLTGSALGHPEEEAIDVLCRLPATPPQFDFAWRLWHGSSTAPDLRRFRHSEPALALPSPMSSSPWEELKVVTRLNTVTLRVALLVATCRFGTYNVGIWIKRFLDFLAEILDHLVSASASPVAAARASDDNAESLLVAREIATAFVWTTWTRCQLLFLRFLLGNQLRSGYEEQWNQMLALRGTGMLMNPSIRATLYGWKNERVPYMCSWAFKLLRSQRAALMLDFRYFHTRYADLHGGRKARCLWDCEEACDGGHPLGCGRFQDRRLVAEEQSVHAHHSNGSSHRLLKWKRGDTCRMLTWNRDSYVSVRGPVAISAADPSNGTVVYVGATESTMAISHVWSHGHGGRPHTGINSCLHERFSKLARRYGCDSYWIDTLSIPDEHALRQRAISHINQLFATSRAVLVLDRDLMDIDVSAAPGSVGLVESVLATFLVCDWNVRAWTMLEAMRGCHNLQLLCRDDRTLSLRDSLGMLYGKGRVDLAVLFLATQHLMPSHADPFRRQSSRKTLEGAAALLSHRHATREGDDVVIWSLLTNPGVARYSAADLWSSLVGRELQTAFLMSDTERLENVPGFSWAPVTPYIRRPNESARTSSSPLGPYLVYEGAGSEKAEITARGASGALDGVPAPPRGRRSVSGCTRNLHHDAQRW